MGIYPGNRRLLAVLRGAAALADDISRRNPDRWGSPFDEDRLMADLLISGLRADPALMVALNEPYSPADHVYYTIARHSGRRGLPAAMIEICNDEICGEAGQRSWQTGWPRFSS